MKVLSLFDGISCGRVALDRLNIPVEAYVAFETDKYATQVSRKNYPSTEHKGDVFYGDYTKYKGFDLLLGGSPCFTAGNLVYTNKGMVPIEEIKVGDMVLTHNNRFRPVTHIGNKLADVWSVKFSDMPEFSVTENHPFYVREAKRYWNENLEKTAKSFSDYKWVEVKDLNENIYSSSPVIDKDINDYNINEDEAYVLGLLLSCGVIKNNKIVLYTNKNIITNIKDEFLLDNSRLIINEESKHKILIRSNRLTKFALKNNLINDNSKYLSSTIINLPTKLLESFLEGYVDGSGEYSKKWNLYSIKTDDKLIAYSLGLIIQKIYKVSPNICSQNTNNSTSYAIVFGKTLKNNSLSKKIGNTIHSPFKSKVYIGKDTVYNISVAEDESYVCNNKIVHNCTYWSIAKNNREVTPDGIGGQLFMQYVRALKESECKYFIYENNYSIHQNIKDFISEQLGVQPIMINSALVSAQQRKRCYWTNIPGVTQPEDLKIILKDILENHPVDKKYEIDPKGCAMRGRYLKDNSGDTQQQIEIRKDDKTNAITTVAKDCLICEPVILQRGHGFNKGGIKKDKCPTITANGSFAHNDSIIEPCQGINLNNYVDKKYEEYAKEHNGEIPEIFNPYNKRKLEDKSPTLTTGAGSTTTSATVLVFQPIRIGTIGNGGQGERIYSIKGKSVTLSANGGGRGAKTGLYKVDLPDGDYIIRKLTPVEAERLQTLPDNYTAFGMTEDGKLVKISNTQRFRQVGNGWTVNVIAHILSFLPNEYLT